MSSIRVLGVIPARYQSSRFPGKPLAEIAGRSMVMRVYDRVLASGVCNDVVVATDDRRILEHVTTMGGMAVMTSQEHVSGTSRCLEAMEILASQHCGPWDAVINIQGDEPFIAADDLRLLAGAFSDPEVELATLIAPITRLEEIEDPNVVKAVPGTKGRAIYFSRSPVPYVRDIPREQWAASGVFFRHLGIYAYSTVTLKRLPGLPPAPAEQAESLEQLRWLSAGITIRALVSGSAGFGVDTPADLLKAEDMLRQGKL